jgi:hypothetical protein
MGKFEVPRHAVEQSGQEVPAHTGDSSTSREETGFSVPDRAIHDLGRIAGEASDAAELLVGAEEEAKAGPESGAPESPADEWTRGRNQSLAGRNFSFYGGETADIFSELKPRHRKKVISLTNKLIELYADRGVTKQTVGLLKDNDIARYFRLNPGTAVMGEAYDEFYIVCMGKPLENRRLGGKQESEIASIRHHGRKVRVHNFMDMEIGRAFGGPKRLVPRLNDNEWLPTILAVTRMEPW